MRVFRQNYIPSLRPERAKNDVAATARLPAFSRPNQTRSVSLDRCRALGNQAIQSLLQFQGSQAKLSVSQPDDRYEQEADRIAEQVLRMPIPPRQGDRAPKYQPLPTQIAENPQSTPQPKLNRNLIQTKRIERSTPHDSFPTKIPKHSAPQSWQPLNQSVRNFFEPRFRHDFSQVRVRTDAESAHSLGARAYTQGHDITFNVGEYAPGSHQGNRLLAHELAHVIQQSNGPLQNTGMIQRKCQENRPNSAEGWAIFVKANDQLAAYRDEDGAVHFMREFQRQHPDREFICYRAGAENWQVWSRTRRETPPSPEPRETVPAPNPPAESSPGSPSSPAPAGGVTRTFSLTFDDGPHVASLGTNSNLTEKVLDELSSRSIKAAFFIQTGVSYRGAHPVGRQLVRRMLRDGHRVGIHTGGTRDHELHTNAQRAGRLSGELTSAREYIDQQRETLCQDTNLTSEQRAALCQDTEEAQTTLVRPPTGVSNSAVERTYSSLGLTNLLWDIDGDGGSNLSLPTLKARVRSEIDTVHRRGWTGTTPWAPHIVVLYHDIQSGTANNIGALIDEIETKTSEVSGDTARFDVP